MMLLIDKPSGISSFGVVGRVRKMLSEREGKKIKVGHTGTLDPFATGLLILMTGADTKRCGEFLKLDKEYVATLRLGLVSSTGDPEGEISKFGGEDAAAADGESCDERAVLMDEIERVLAKFRGRIKQIPPAFSAIKIGGRRAYELARKGEKVELPEREIEIYGLEILDYKWPELKIRVACSSGTYIRSLAEDIGKELGVGAYLTELRRTKVGEYDVKDAKKMEEV